MLRISSVGKIKESQDQQQPPQQQQQQQQQQPQIPQHQTPQQPQQQPPQQQQQQRFILRQASMAAKSIEQWLLDQNSWTRLRPEKRDYYLGIWSKGLKDLQELPNIKSPDGRMNEGSVYMAVNDPDYDYLLDVVMREGQKQFNVAAEGEKLRSSSQRFQQTMQSLVPLDSSKGGFTTFENRTW